MKFLSFCLLFGCFCMFGCDGATLKEVMNNYGYVELQPPMNLVPAGTIIEKQSNNPVTLEIICTQSEALGDKFVAPVSKTYNLDLTEKVSTTFDLDASYLTQITADANYKAVKNIRLTISNPQIMQLSAAAVLASLPNRQPSCQQAITAYLNGHRNITMVSSVLIADAVYDVQFDTSFNLDASAKQEVLKGLSPKLGVSYSNTGEDKITGQALFWGIKENPILVTLENKGTLQNIASSQSEKNISMINSFIEKVGVDKQILPVTSSVVTIKLKQRQNEN